MNKKKIVNDPVWGFISIPSDLTYDLICHPFFQRLRRIVQMGLSFLVYPGAMHTRFHHSIGCLYLMSEALDTLQGKGVFITEEEREGACAAILLHDLGHGPFSHVLEQTVLPGVSHEEMSLFFMEELNRQMGGRLGMAIEIFTNRYAKKFLHQLVSGQLDVDRLDYLNRDSFFTGVQEGAVGTERIIKMMNVCNGQLVVEEKGIYSLEKFVLSRRMMYWQVYLHKTSVCAELMLIHAIRRAKELWERGKNLGGSPIFWELQNRLKENRGKDINQWLPLFAQIDDTDIWVCLKVWSRDQDFILSELSSRLLRRDLFHAEVQNKPFEADYITRIKDHLRRGNAIKEEDLSYLVYLKELSPTTYNPKGEGIWILRKDGSMDDITKISELLDRHFVMKVDIKYILCY